jgi:transcriptional regulator with XRE-family HTH domain
MTHSEIMPDHDLLKTQSIGEFCALIRDREGLTQSDLAQRIGQSRNTITRVEMGLIERPYELLSYLLKWLSDSETAHLLELLRQIDLKHLYARLERKDPLTRD